MRIPTMTFIALLLVAPGLAAGDEAEVVEAAACRWITTYATGDLDALMALYDPETQVMLHGQHALRDLAAVRGFFEAGGDTDDGMTRFDLLIDEIVVHGDIAHLVSRYWLERTNAEGETVYRDVGRSLLLYRRGGDGRWLIYRDIDQATPDARWDERPAPGAGSCA